MAVAFVFLLVGLVLGLVVGMLLTKSRMLEEKTSLVASRNVLQNETDQLRRQLSEQEKRHTSQIDELRQQQKEQLEQQSALIREQINNASEQILKKRAEELQRNNTAQLSTILTPLHERLQQMREAVEKSERGQSLAMERLDAVIKENLRQVHEVGERADKLAEALTSENKTQGDFGELRLRTLLINMGLEEGVQFEEQATMRDERGKTIYEEENGRRMMPDVILHFPDDRDVIIDSKMSLKAFEEYFNAESEEDKARALTRHIASVRSHVKELAHKNYSSFIRKGRQKLDFVLMYVYSESALQLALANDVTLYRSPSSLNCSHFAAMVAEACTKLYSACR